MSSGLSYARRIARLRARIFGGVVRKTSKQDYRVVEVFSRRPPEQYLPSWYPPLGRYSSILFRLRHLGLYKDDHQDFIEEMQAQRKERGKGPPKKGQGKRSKKKGK